MPGSSASSLAKTDPTGLPRFLAYARPRPRNDDTLKTKTCNEFVLDDVPLGSSVSFLDYDGVALFAGAFERIRNDRMEGPSVVCSSRADLDLREREFHSLVSHDKTVIFLVPHLAQRVGFSDVDPAWDLFRRIARSLNLRWRCRDEPSPLVESYAPEFKEYINRFGTGYVEFFFDKAQEDIWKPLCGAPNTTLGLAVIGKIFMLPSPLVQTQDQAQQVIEASIEATLAYRKRVSSHMPTWAGEFVFAREKTLQGELEEIQKKALAIEGQIERYAKFKGALCYQSEPLVKVVSDIMRELLGIMLTLDDKCIEDATLRDDRDNILGVFEIKGVKGNFTRANVNQVDSHRERLEVPPNTPGILIMNTLMNSDSLEDKDQRPHPDIIRKAAADGVLLIRTLDLLRYASAVEDGSLTKEEFKRITLSESGWLNVENGTAKIVRS